MLSVLVFSTTNRCPIECPFCGAECNPRNRDRLSLEFMTSVIDQAQDLGSLEVVVFTGGEPLLLGQDLLAAVRYCADHGLKTRVVTNAYWARSDVAADRWLSRLVDAGLSEINISCDDYHQREIPVENVRPADDTARRIGLPCLVGHKEILSGSIHEESLSELLGVPMERFRYGQVNPDNDVYLSSFNVPIAPQMHLIPDEEILFPDSDDWKAPCTSVMENIVVTPQREVGICCGMIPRSVREVVVGSLDEAPLAQILFEADRDLIVNWLALEGPYGLMRFIQERAPEIRFRDRYVGPCHLCSEILTRPDCRAVLTRHAGEHAEALGVKRCVYDASRSEPVAVPAR